MSEVMQKTQTAESTASHQSSREAVRETPPLMPPANILEDAHGVTLLVEMQPYAMVFSRSLFVSLLDRAERLIPSLSPESLKDDAPLMRPPGVQKSARVRGCERSFPSDRHEHG